MNKKEFSCEACGARAERLSMRDSDGKFVCPDCVPEKERQQLRKARAEAGSR